MPDNRRPSKRFQDVLLWQKAQAWVARVYRFTERFPKQERYGLTAQLRDAAVSVPNNFAEGFKRRTMNDKVRSYNIAQSSLEESRGLLMLSHDLGYGDPAILLRDAEEIARIFEGYVAGLRRRQRRKARASEHRVPGTVY